jgi:hypothetical protein
MVILSRNGNNNAVTINHRRVSAKYKAVREAVQTIVDDVLADEEVITGATPDVDLALAEVLENTYGFQIQHYQPEPRVKGRIY